MSAGGQAGHAAKKVKAPVEVHHRPAPGSLMETVEVLGEQDLALA
jgi:hypothetical protein